MKLDTCRDLHTCNSRIRHPDFRHVCEHRSASLEHIVDLVRALIIPSDTKRATSEEVDLVLSFAATVTNFAAEKQTM
eukprot:12764583-Prorocentrum_lima.AAC.1